ncbi:hypothetical protein F5B22DRAFT_628247 [Xylaria bambusicola]|uniref:uncharacterized protein n=1 Tax=Xylaria bambusicola TaxID=326684 RepID=UPI00200740A4|nr:uncharacterized protein F5B22DRAFT_628247 [Xylaria bambusicola]KAI0505341.1 hypothetical protein F5B22DRAFT_628247 [Xylaria bambusicola]
MNLHGIAAAIMFLRRIFAFSGVHTLFGANESRLMQFAWKAEPLSDQTKPEEVQALLQELEVPIQRGESLTLLQVLDHITMADFWGSASLRLDSPNILVRKEGRRQKLVLDKSDIKDIYKREVVTLQMGDSIEEKLRIRYQDTLPLRGRSKGVAKRNCNFPLIIRLHCRPYEREDSQPALTSFSDFRSFTVRQEAIDEAGLEEREHIYTLIACYKCPSTGQKTDTHGELQLWTKGGVPIGPINEPLDRRDTLFIHDPGFCIGLSDKVESVLLYGRVDLTNYKEDHRAAEVVKNTFWPSQYQWVKYNQKQKQTPKTASHDLSTLFRDGIRGPTLDRPTL